MFDIDHKKIFVAGHNGMVGRAVCRHLNTKNCEILTASRNDLDLTNQGQVDDWFEKNKPDAVIMCAGHVGGIHANSHYPADFIYRNIMMAMNVIHASHEYEVEKLLYLGSSCIYPRECAQPMTEDQLMTGGLEPTNAPYAMAKLAGINACQSYRRQYGSNFISAIPCNLYGPYDNFDPLNSHVPSALLSRFHQAKINSDPSVTLWGTGNTIREFMHVDDLANGLIFLLQNYDALEPINIGTGQGISINDFAVKIKNIVGYNGEIDHDLSRPDGMMEKIMDVSKLKQMGWKSSISLDDGLQNFYDWDLNHVA